MLDYGRESQGRETGRPERARGPPCLQKEGRGLEIGVETVGLGGQTMVGRSDKNVLAETLKAGLTILITLLLLY